MGCLSPDDRRRLLACLARLESDHAGEKLAAVAAAGRILDAAGLRWCQIEDALTPLPALASSFPNDHPTVDVMLHDLAAAPLPDTVRAFVNGIAAHWRRSGRLSTKQVEALARTWSRNCKRAA